MEKYKAGQIRDPRNLFRECALRGIKDPCQITPDEIVAEFYVCKHNLALLEKHGPLLQLRFLKQLVTTAKKQGDTLWASCVTGIIQKEAIHKRWHWIDQSTRQARGSLTVQVKIPTTDGGVDEFKTKEGVFNAVSATLVERFQSGLVANCHQGTFFEDVGHLADGPVAQQILEGTYEYPSDLDPATRLLFE